MPEFVPEMLCHHEQLAGGEPSGGVSSALVSSVSSCLFLSLLISENLVPFFGCLFSEATETRSLEDQSAMPRICGGEVCLFYGVRRPLRSLGMTSVHIE